MPLKKSELYSSLWPSCDELRGGMDASQYKDYILVRLFVKYVSDKAASQKNDLLDVPKGGSLADMVTLKGDKEIGDTMNKIVAKLAEANDLKGVIAAAAQGEMDRVSQTLTGRVRQPAERYATPLPQLDGEVAKNHLTEKEIKALDRFVTMYLDCAEDQAECGIPMTRRDWAAKLNAFLQFNERDLLDHPGKVTTAIAKACAESEFGNRATDRGPMTASVCIQAE